jgi:hypothetical protein
VCGMAVTAGAQVCRIAEGRECRWRVFTSTASMAIQATGAMAIIVGDIDLGASDDPARSLFTLSMVTGAVMLLAGLLRLGGYLRFVSNSVMTGFITAIGINIVLGQLDSAEHYSGWSGSAPVLNNALANQRPMPLRYGTSAVAAAGICALCCSPSDCDDNRCERGSMVLVPRRAEHLARPVQDFLRTLTEDLGGLSLDRGGVEAVLDPPTSCCEFREHLAVHDRINLALERCSPLAGDVGRKVVGPVTQRDRANRADLSDQIVKRRPR